MSAVLAAPVVTLKTTGTASADPFTLADIADIKAPAGIQAKLATAEMGRAPLPGNTRTITLGDVTLKLRQAGIDPESIGFTGATTITVSPVGQAQPAASAPVTTAIQPSATSTAQAAPVALKPVSLKAGDHVSVMYVDGPVSVSLDGSLMNAAAIGQVVQVRTTFSTRILTGTLVDDHTVKI